MIETQVKCIYMTTVFTRTPVRITFVGGGSDLPQFYRNDDRGGVTVTAAINRYVNVIVHDSSESNFKVVYSQREVVDSYDDVAHPAAREALRLVNVGRYVEVVSLGDVSSKGTGLGTGSSYLVGLINALATYKGLANTGDSTLHGQTPSGTAYQEWLARSAVHIERNVLKEAGGKQDQYIASYGGIRRFDFLPDEGVKIESIRMTTEEVKQFQEHLLLINTGINRSSSKTHYSNMHNDNTALYSKMRDMAVQYSDDLANGRWKVTGEMLADTWRVKKRLGSVTTVEIDELYEKALKFGAEGGKLLGAGMGGYLMVYADRQAQERIMTGIGLREDMVIRPKIDTEGSTVIYSNP